MAVVTILTTQQITTVITATTPLDNETHSVTNSVANNIYVRT